MKLRLARKIVKAIDTPRASAYSEGKKNKALDRVEHTKESRRATAFWISLMHDLGVERRAEILRDTGAPGMAFRLLMSEKW